MRWIVANASPIRKDNEIIGAVSSFIDITELKRAEQSVRQLNEALIARNADLHAERERWRQVVMGIADEVWLADVEGKMSLVNLPEVTRMDLAEFENKTVNQIADDVEILNPDGTVRPFQDAPLLRSLRGETVRGEEIMRRRSDGAERWRQYSSAPIRDQDGHIIGAVAVVRDTTELKNAEQRLKGRTRQLEEANAELQQFAYVASHDLREPLRMVTSFSQMLQKRYRNKLGAEADESIRFIVDGAARMQNLIDDLLSYSRVSSKGLPFEHTSMQEVLDNVLKDLAMAIQESGASTTSDPLPAVKADPTLDASAIAEPDQ